jgi:hypothetical protein
VDVNILVNKTVHRNSSLLFTICFTDAAKLAKSSLLQFQYKTCFIVITTNSQLFLVANWSNEQKPCFIDYYRQNIILWNTLFYDYKL